MENLILENGQFMFMVHYLNGSAGNNLLYYDHVIIVRYLYDFNFKKMYGIAVLSLHN